MQGDANIKSKFQKLQSSVPAAEMEKWKEQQKLIRSKIIDHCQQNSPLLNKKRVGMRVAGVDLSARKDNPNIVCAGIIIWQITDDCVKEENQKDSLKFKGKVVCELMEVIRCQQAYVPGFLAFRQVPALYHLFMKLKESKPDLYPDLIIVDGNGILHQNQCGLACHLGVLLGVPTLGVGKTLFYVDGLSKQKVKAQCERDLVLNKEKVSFLCGDSSRVWGAAITPTADCSNPVYVSIGHLIDLKTAVEWVGALSLFRVVEPIRLADKKSRQIVQSWKGNIDDLQQYPMIMLSEALKEQKEVDEQKKMKDDN